jgi:hypothetical protein
MDSQEIATGIISLTAPGIVGLEKSERREIARRVNESTAAARVIELMGHTVRHCRFPVVVFRPQVLKTGYRCGCGTQDFQLLVHHLAATRSKSVQDARLSRVGTFR